ncbi:MAG TPA: response regulator [Bacteroidales bacterium]|nr:response regulator [Bacteroidales bacterium]
MKPKVFIVDDQPEVYQAIKMFLGSSYETVYHNNGQGAYNELSNGNIPDIILADIKMPGLDGYELLVHIKQNESLNKIPVVMISNLDASKERGRFISAGASDYMEKPFNANNLISRVSSFLNPMSTATSCA